MTKNKSIKNNEASVKRLVQAGQGGEPTTFEIKIGKRDIPLLESVMPGFEGEKLQVDSIRLRRIPRDVKYAPYQYNYSIDFIEKSTLFDKDGNVKSKPKNVTLKVLDQNFNLPSGYKKTIEELLLNASVKAIQSWGMANRAKGIPETPFLAIQTWPGKDLIVEMKTDENARQKPKKGDIVYFQNKYSSKMQHGIFEIKNIGADGKSAELTFLEWADHLISKAWKQAAKYKKPIWRIAWNETWFLEDLKHAKCYGLESKKSGAKANKNRAEKAEIQGFVWKNEPAKIIKMDLKEIVAYLTELKDEGILYDFYGDQDIVVKAGLMKTITGEEKPKDVDEHIDERTAFLELKEEIEGYDDKPGDLVEITGETAGLYVENPNAFNVWKVLAGFKATWAADDREKGQRHVETKATRLVNKIIKCK